MTTLHAGSERRLYRDRDRAILGGVCAGIAEFLGFNLRVTRCLAFIAFLMAMPVAIIAYLAAVFLIPSVSNGEYASRSERRESRRREKRQKRANRKQHEEVEVPESTIAADINRRCQTMDERLVTLEKHVTSKRFQLEQELSRL